jgi:hypothetical protein
MNHVYLDQNIIDRIDKGLKEEVVKFLGKNRLIPVVSFTSGALGDSYDPAGTFL